MDTKTKILKFLAQKTGRFVIAVVFAFAIWGIFTAALTSQNMFFVASVIAICGIFGWKALNRITPSMFLWMSFMGWVMYFVAKGLISACIGVIIAPIKIANMLSVYAMKAINVSAEYIKAGYDAAKSGEDDNQN